MTRYGIVLGRFQPLHIGHMEYLEAARSNCSRLVVGITNPDIELLRFNEADPKRSTVESNPYTYFDRHEMVTGALRGARWQCDDFTIVPADLDKEDKLKQFLPPPKRSTVFITVYDAWGEEKSRRLQDLDYRVEILWRRNMADRVTSGTEIRGLMKSGEPWQHLVPPEVALLLEGSYSIDLRRGNEN